MKSFESKWNKDRILSTIIESLKHNELSIADIQRKINMKRSTLIYYLNLLEAQGLIEKGKREEKKTGRPSMIRIPKDKISEMKRREKNKKKYALEILQDLSNKKKGGMKIDDFHSLIKFDPSKKDWKDKFNSTLNVQYSNFVENIIRISEEGEKFLKENKK